MLRKLGMAATLLLLNMPLHAQVIPAPTSINYQGRIATPDGTPVPDGTYSIRFSLWDAATGGTEKWNQTLANVQVKNGTFAVALNANSANLFDGNLWLETKIGTDAALTPRQPLATVPYASKANTVPDGAIGSNQLANNAVATAKIADGAVTAAKLAGGVLNFWNLGGNASTNPASQFLGTTDGQPLAFRTANALRMTLGASGGLGINNADPNSFYALTLTAPDANQGTLLFRNNNNTNRWHLALTSSGTSNALNFVESNIAANRLVLAPGGNVGIGTAAPGMSLEVTQRNYYSSPSLGVAYSPTNYLYMHSGASDPSLIWNSTSVMRFGSETGRGVGYVEHARITPPSADSADQSQTAVSNTYTANLGIEPAQAFQPSRTGYITKIRVYATANSPSGLIAAYIFRGSTTSSTALWVNSFDNQSGAIGWRDYPVDPPLLVSANQTYTLQLRGGSQMQVGYAASNPYIRGLSNIGANNDLAFEVVMSNQGGTSLSNGLTVYAGTAYGNTLNVVTAGQATYGIRLTNGFAPTETGMQVLNDGNFQITTNINGGAFARLDSTGTWTSTSDRRLKSDIQPLDGLLEKALKLQPVSYFFKAQDKQHDPNRHIGFVAQDVETLFPSLVAGTDTKTLNYSGLSVVAIGALKEMNEQMQTDRKRIETLETENAALRERLERIEAALSRQGNR